MSLLRFALSVAFVVAPAYALAHQAPPPPPRFSMQRPRVDYTAWLSLGGGALVAPSTHTGVFDLRVGGDATFAVSGDGDVRVGPFVDVATATFAGVSGVVGAELFVGAIPKPLRMFLYPGEGTFVARLGAGWALRDGAFGAATSTPVASLTVAYGYRAPFSLREPRDMVAPEPGMRAPDRYMTGARLWVNTTVDLAGDPAWQLTGGVEFDPVGGFRYLFGIY